MERLFSLCFIIFANIYGISSNSTYKDLLSHVVDQADEPFLPPVLDASKPLHVGVILGLQDISRVDPANNVVEISLMISVTWNSSITWNPADYNSIPFISVPRKLVWYPKLAILNAAHHYEDITPPTTTVFSNGMAGLLHHHHVQILCDLSMGSNVCNVSVGLATHGNNLVRLADPRNLPQGVAAFFHLAKHNSPAWPVQESRNVKTSFRQAGLPGEKEQIDLEFSFRNSRRSYNGRKNVFQWN